MQVRYTTTRVGMAIVGGGVVLADTSLNMANQYAQSGLRMDVLGLTLMLAIATTFGTYFVVELLKSKNAYERYVCSVIVAAGVAIGMTYSFQHSVSRYTSVYQEHLKVLAKDEQRRRIETSQDRLELAAIEDTIKTENLMHRISAECVDDLYLKDETGGVRVIKNVRYEPDSPYARYFKECPAVHARLAELKAEKRQGEGRLIALTEVALWEVDGGAGTMSLYLPFTQEQISIYIPGLPAIALLLFSIMFGLGLSGERVEAEFDLALTGDAAKEDKAQRFMVAFKEANGRWPTKQEVAQISGLSPQRADTLRKRVMARKKK